MPKQFAWIKFELCKPEKCNPEEGKCIAMRACKKSILTQEEVYENPMIFPSEMCLGCGDCVSECPFKAIQI